MFKLLFSFAQRRAISFGSIQRVIARALKSKEQSAAFYFKYAQALKPYSVKQAAVFTAMGTQELQNYKKLSLLSRSRYVKAIDPLYDRPSFFRRKLFPANTGAAAATQSVLNPSKTDKQTLLTWIQPGLAGLMDGSVSTLAPIFAAAFATGDTYKTFLIGLSASIGAGLSMGFTEATHDDGKLSGRGSPLKRGLACGVMTTLGGLGHTLPYLISSFYVATTIAFIAVFLELAAIVWIQNKFMSTPFLRASLQVIIGGALVFATGIFIGSI
ncbi:hypothetical protein [Bartonella sp. CB175]|uniref:hypothetical protein n=1 Tax=Bartonella sp. CB175 TaxID=3112256 RepID=UPI00300E2116